VKCIQLLWVNESGSALLPVRSEVWLHAATRRRCDYHSPMTTCRSSVASPRVVAYSCAQVVHFLEHLRRHIPGKSLAIWDGSPIHGNQAIKTFLAETAAGRLRLVQLPGWAPRPEPGRRHLGVPQIRRAAKRVQRESDGSPAVTATHRSSPPEAAGHPGFWSVMPATSY
jgi:hypothetical protein